MVYQFEDKDCNTPDLEDYKFRCAAQLLRSSFFQNECKEIFDMTALPNIIAPALLRKQVNTDKDKKTLFGKPVSISQSTLSAMSQLVADNKIDILNLEDLSGDQFFKL